jgi:hypothetical protein
MKTLYDTLLKFNVSFVTRAETFDLTLHGKNLLFFVNVLKGLKNIRTHTKTKSYAKTNYRDITFTFNKDSLSFYEFSNGRIGVLEYSISSGVFHLWNIPNLSQPKSFHVNLNDFLSIFKNMTKNRIANIRFDPKNEKVSIYLMKTGKKIGSTNIEIELLEKPDTPNLTKKLKLKNIEHEEMAEAMVSPIQLKNDLKYYKKSKTPKYNFLSFKLHASTSKFNIGVHNLRKKLKDWVIIEESVINQWKKDSTGFYSFAVIYDYISMFKNEDMIRLVFVLTEIMKGESNELDYLLVLSNEPSLHSVSLTLTPLDVKQYLK